MVKKLTILCAFTFFILTGSLYSNSYACHKGRHKCNGGPPSDVCGNPGAAILNITYDFDGAMTLPVNGVVTEIECTKGYCEFTEQINPNFELLLPDPGNTAPGFRDLFEDTAWRKIDSLNPDACFRDDVDNVMKVVAHTISIRISCAGNEGSDLWHASVIGEACPTADPLVRNRCDFANGPLRQAQPKLGARRPDEGSVICSGAGDDCVFPVGDTVTLMGRLGAWWSTDGSDKKLGSTPCRCTISNTPDCPDEVDNGNPIDVPVVITVERVEP